MADKGFNGLLLVKIQLEQSVTNLAETLWVAAIRQISPELLQKEESVGGEHHNEGSEGSVAMNNEAEAQVFSTLSFYMVSEMPSVLGIARYHAYDDHDRTLAVAEDVFHDTPDDFCRLQDNVEDALMNGMDVCVMSHYEPEYFPDINKFIANGDEV